MDPDTTLDNARFVAGAILNGPMTGQSKAVWIEQAELLANSFAALDEWLSNGGFVPKEWDK